MGPFGDQSTPKMPDDGDQSGPVEPAICKHGEVVGYCHACAIEQHDDPESIREEDRHP